MNQHHIAATSSASSELSLLDVLVRQTSAPVAGSVQRLTMAIDADVLHSLDARAARLGTTPVLLRRAALALLESRFTGQAEIVLGTAQGNIFHKVPSEGTVDAWLLTHTTPAVAEDGRSRSVVLKFFSTANLTCRTFPRFRVDWIALSLSSTKRR